MMYDVLPKSLDYGRTSAILAGTIGADEAMKIQNAESRGSFGTGAKAGCNKVTSTSALARNGLIRSFGAAHGANPKDDAVV